jgi:hypothetical protein
MRTWIKNVQGENVAFTGTAWLGRAELQRKVRQKGGLTTSGGNVSTATTILVRGDSSAWKYGDHGAKEHYAARLVAKGEASIALIDDSEFRRLLEHGKPARVSDRLGGEPISWIVPAKKTQFMKAVRIAGPLDREHSALGRVEQSYLRRFLFGTKERADCSLCGRRLPTALLVAAHIKARSHCSRRERLDVPNIVFSACLLGCDALYERGLIGVEEGGRVLSSDSLRGSTLDSVRASFRRRTCEAWTPARADYFRWHIVKRFQGRRI